MADEQKKKIWCVFSVENNYDQPGNNLVAWYSDKPSFEQLLELFGTKIEDAPEDLIIVIANMLQGRTSRFINIDYRLDKVSEGKIENV